MTFAVLALGGGLFAAAAWLGTLLAGVLCRGRVPFADGPQPVPFRRAPFALAGAAIGVALAAHGAGGVQSAVLLIVVAALAAGTAADLTCGMLPDTVTLGPLVLVFAVALADRNPMPVAGAAFAALPFAGAALLSAGRGMGWGDVKLAALGGALLGAGNAALAFTLAGAAAYVVARRSGAVRRPVAFGPYLAGSIAAVLAVGRTF